VFALIGNLTWTEILVVALVAIVVFGRRLPQVAAQTAHRMGRLRRSMEMLWRESGIEDEIRDVKAEVRRNVPRDVRPRHLLKSLEEQLEKRPDPEREKPESEREGDEPGSPEGERREPPA
jgi:Sec-independent protein translocase protein TatA